MDRLTEIKKDWKPTLGWPEDRLDELRHEETDIRWLITELEKKEALLDAIDDATKRIEIKTENAEIKAHTLSKRHLEVLEELENARAEVGRLREFVEEVSLPPYRDSNLASLITTLQLRAAALLEEPPDDT